MGLFYILSAYILLIFMWWWYLLYNKNEKYYSLQKQFIENKESPIFSSLENEHKRQRTMIFGEGTTFIALLLIGVFLVNKNLKRQFKMAQLQSNFMLSITHELKSPLAAIKLNLETILFRALEKDKQNQLLHNSIEDVDRLNNLIENILLAAKIEQNNVLNYKSKISLSNIILETAKLSETYWSDFNFEKNISDNIYIVGDKLMIQSAIMNLIENAVKYSGESKKVLISLSTEDNHAQIKITDFGIPIPKQEEHFIFDKFYRIGQEENRTSKGVGLGLFIVKQVIIVHNGKIELLQKNGIKSFLITLPLQNAA